MEPLSSINGAFYTRPSLFFRPTAENQEPQPILSSNAAPLPVNTPNLELLNQISSETLYEFERIFQDISALSVQSLELDQTPETRGLLQQNVTENLLELGTVLNGLSQGELELVTTVLSGPISDALLNTGSISPSGDSVLSENSLSVDVVETLLNIDITSGQGALDSLELLNILIETISDGIPVTTRLSDLLADQDNTIFNLQIIDTANQDTLETSSGETESETGAESTETVEDEILLPDPPVDSPPTIIELAG